MPRSHEESSKHRESIAGKLRPRVGGAKAQLYQVLLSAVEYGFELAEHHLSKQLLFVFSGRPNIEMAGKLEAMGFDRMEDERMFTIDATGPNRQKAMKIAEQFGTHSSAIKR